MWKHGLVGAVLVGSAWGQVTRRVSTDSAGHQGNDDSGTFVVSTSADGRYVAFRSYASNLVPGDTNNTADVFVVDRQTGQIARASVDSNGNEGDNFCLNPSISSDGRFVAFETAATNLVPGDTNGFFDIFVHDGVTGQTTRVSVDSSGAQGNAFSSYASISSDGRYVAFYSGATNLVPGDTNGWEDVFVHDRTTGETTRISVDSGGNQGNGGSQNPSISSNGRLVAFHSAASNLVVGDANGSIDVFLSDRLLGKTTRVSVDSNGIQGNGHSLDASISGDGRYVAFDSAASNLVFGDTNSSWDVFVHDSITGQTTRVSVDSNGNQGNGNSSTPSLSSDGRFVLFYSYASNLVAGDTNGIGDLFVHDCVTGTTERVSVASDGGEANGDQGQSRISSDGRCVAFASLATNLVPGDTNQKWDVFVRDRYASGFTSLCEPGLGGVMPCPCLNPPSGPGLGCDNSAATGGALLTASGAAYLSSDSLVFTTIGEKPTATSVLLQGTSLVGIGAVYGQGVRCVGGTLKRLFTKTASGGSITAPNFGAGDPSVSTRSATRGSPISGGDSRYYLVFYRDPVVLGGCPASSTFNCTQTGMVTWSP